MKIIAGVECLTLAPSETAISHACAANTVAKTYLLAKPRLSGRYSCQAMLSRLLQYARESKGDYGKSLLSDH